MLPSWGPSASSSRRDVSASPSRAQPTSLSRRGLLATAHLRPWSSRRARTASGRPLRHRYQPSTGAKVTNQGKVGAGGSRCDASISSLLLPSIPIAAPSYGALGRPGPTGTAPFLPRSHSSLCPVATPVSFAPSSPPVTATPRAHPLLFPRSSPPLPSPAAPTLILASLYIFA